MSGTAVSREARTFGITGSAKARTSCAARDTTRAGAGSACRRRCRALPRARHNCSACSPANASQPSTSATGQKDAYGMLTGAVSRLAGTASVDARWRSGQWQRARKSAMTARSLVRGRGPRRHRRRQPLQRHGRHRHQAEDKLQGDQPPEPHAHRGRQRRDGAAQAPHDASDDRGFDRRAQQRDAAARGFRCEACRPATRAS